jgi:hypothetical protein
VIAALSVALSACVGARAGVVAPGETGSGPAFGFDQVPSGAVLAERTVPYEFTGLSDDPADPLPPVELFARGTITSRVIRDSETGGLTFIYEGTQTATNSIIDLNTLVLRGFTGFTTDVLHGQSDTLVRRSADGDTISLDFSFSENVDGVFVVRTNATNFKAADNLDVGMEFQPDEIRVTQTFGAYQPAADAGPGPTPVPLPPAAASAVAAVACLGAARGLRRRTGL